MDMNDTSKHAGWGVLFLS